MNRKFDGFKKTGPDNDIEAAIAEHCRKHNIEPLDALKLWPVLIRRQWLKRFLAHEELFRRTLEVPGDIAELGVFRGADLFTWANLLECFCVGDRTKTVWGFESYAGFTKFSKQDWRPVKHAHKSVGGFKLSKDDEVAFFEAVSIFDKDRFVPWKKRIKMVVGDITKTAGNFVAENPGVRFSLLHFDCDLYAPTKAALESFWPLLTRGGVAIFDEYNIPDWPGETAAVDEYFADKPVAFKKFAWTNAPAAYVFKP